MEMSRDHLRGLAAEFGVRADVFEKVVRLLVVLRRIRADELLGRHCVLKGGTALNVFWLPLPRLSVDIDLNFVGLISPRELRARRADIDQRIVRACQLAGCRVMRVPFGHAGGKFRLRFASLFGGEQNLELDLNLVSRIPFYRLTERQSVVPGLEAEKALTYSLPELAAGKFVALMSRVVARDRFDALQLLRLHPGLLEQREFRVAFVCLAAAGRQDPRRWPRELPPLSDRDVSYKLAPTLRNSDELWLGLSTRSMAAQLNDRLAKVIPRLVEWTDHELYFLEGLLDMGRLDVFWLTEDLQLRAQIQAQPMLIWKRRHIRRIKGWRAIEDDSDW